MEPVDLALRFVERINAADLEGMAALMSPHHKLVDSLGEEIKGRERALSVWEDYFKMVPGYRIEVKESLSRSPVVVLLGTARGGFRRPGGRPGGKKWSTPAAWRAVIRDGRVAVWCVYADNEPIRRLITAGSA